MLVDYLALAKAARPYQIRGPHEDLSSWDPAVPLHTSPILLPSLDGPRVHRADAPLCACTPAAGSLLCRRHGPLRYEVEAHQWIMVKTDGFTLVEPGAVLHTELRPVPLCLCRRCGMAWRYHVGVDRRCLLGPTTFHEGDEPEPLSWTTHQVQGPVGFQGATPSMTQAWRSNPGLFGSQGAQGVQGQQVGKSVSMGVRVRSPLQTYSSTIIKAQQELLSYTTPIHKILEDHSMKEVPSELLVRLYAMRTLSRHPTWDNRWGWDAVTLVTQIHYDWKLSYAPAQPT